MSRLQRKVRRSHLKDELAQLKFVLSKVKPFVEAQEQLNRAYEQGVYAGVEQERVRVAKENESKVPVEVLHTNPEDGLKDERETNP